MRGQGPECLTARPGAAVVKGSKPATPPAPTHRGSPLPVGETAASNGKKGQLSLMVVVLGPGPSPIPGAITVKDSAPVTNKEWGAE